MSDKPKEIWEYFPDYSLSSNLIADEGLMSSRKACYEPKALLLRSQFLQVALDLTEQRAASGDEQCPLNIADDLLQRAGKAYEAHLRNCSLDDLSIHESSPSPVDPPYKWLWLFKPREQFSQRAWESIVALLGSVWEWARAWHLDHYVYVHFVCLVLMEAYPLFFFDEEDQPSLSSRPRFTDPEPGDISEITTSRPASVTLHDPSIVSVNERASFFNMNGRRVLATDEHGDPKVVVSLTRCKKTMSPFGGSLAGLYRIPQKNLSPQRYRRHQRALSLMSEYGRHLTHAYGEKMHRKSRGIKRHRTQQPGKNCTSRIKHSWRSALSKLARWRLYLLDLKQKYPFIGDQAA